MDNGTDFLATELLKELKDENVRKDEQIKRMQKNALIKDVIYALSILLVVAGFIFYLLQYDFINTTTYSAEGTYALIDSDGNVIGYDITEDEFKKVLEVLDLGEGDGTPSTGESKGEE